MKSDQFKVMLNGVEISRKTHPIHAMNVAQIRASSVYKDPCTMLVVREPVLGPASVLYQIDRDMHGVVHTTTINAED